MGTCGTKDDVKPTLRSSDNYEKREQSQTLPSFLSSAEYKATCSLLTNSSASLESKLTHLKEKHSLFLRRHSKEVTSISVSYDKSFIATSSKDCTVRFWNLIKRKQIGEIVHDKEVNQVVILRNQSKIITLSSNTEIAVWSLPSYSVLCKYSNFPFPMGSIQVSDNPKELYVGGGYLPQQDTCPIRVINLETGEQLRSYEGHRAAANQIVFTSDYKYFASCSGGQYMTVNDNSVQFWDVREDQPKASYSDFRSFVNSVCISNALKYVLAGCKDCSIHILTYGLVKVNIFRGHTSAVNSLALTPDELFLVSGGADSVVKVWDLQKQWVFSEHNLSTVYSVAVQDSFIVAGCMCTVKVFEFSGKLEFGMPGHHGEIQTLKINPGSHYLLSGSVGKIGHDKTIQIWNLFTGEQEKVINQLPAFSDLQLNSDGTGILFKLDDGSKKAYSVRGDKKWVKKSTKLEFLLVANHGFKLR